MTACLPCTVGDVAKLPGQLHGKHDRCFVERGQSIEPWLQQAAKILILIKVLLQDVFCLGAWHQSKGMDPLSAYLLCNQAAEASVRGP